ncbi:Inosose dehydratase [Arenibacter antarcticus]|uniref:Hydroxypyruvate isomerase family protein n=1 Tax=Arenibacter antarcticus TaxID=2040469 RepID=A0ABW5VEJ8_9FLAO|nr:TIM barrel protein [Arenibacter sp. H213]MCM4166476.1 xylose isomerase [Arenibacter sp. H213]
MNRKEFLRNGMLGGAALTLFSGRALSNEPEHLEPFDAMAPFNMKFSPDFDIFNQGDGASFEEQLEWGYDSGFRAWESTWLSRSTVSEQKEIKRVMDRLGMDFGQFVGTMSFKEVTFAGKDKAIRERVLREVRESVEIAKRMDTKYIHNVLGVADPKLPWDFQMANAIELLKQVAEIYEPHGLVMVMETMNHKINHPGMFLHEIPQAYAMAKAVQSPSVKILFDVYHVQIQEGNLIPTMDYAWDEIGYIQIGDTPGRNEPGTGEINFKNVLQHIQDKGYRGFVGLEHGISGNGEEGDKAALKAYREVDPK